MSRKGKICMHPIFLYPPCCKWVSLELHDNVVFLSIASDSRGLRPFNNPYLVPISMLKEPCLHMQVAMIGVREARFMHQEHPMKFSFTTHQRMRSSRQERKQDTRPVSADALDAIDAAAHSLYNVCYGISLEEESYL